MMHGNKVNSLRHKSLHRVAYYESPNIFTLHEVTSLYFKISTLRIYANSTHSCYLVSNKHITKN